jgi:3-isopropylmalate dehydrogenase
VDIKSQMELVHGLIGGTAYDETGSPLPQATLDAAKECDSILLGAVGGYQWEKLERDLRPERGLLGLRAEMDLFSNLRPAILYPQLASASTLKEVVVSGLDLVKVSLSHHKLFRQSSHAPIPYLAYDFYSKNQ